MCVFWTTYSIAIFNSFFTSSRGTAGSSMAWNGTEWRHTPLLVPKVTMLVPSQMTQMHQTLDEWSLCVLHSRTYKDGEGRRDCQVHPSPLSPGTPSPLPPSTPSLLSPLPLTCMLGVIRGRGVPGDKGEGVPGDKGEGCTW